MLGILPGLVGTIQATETVKLILGIGETLAGRFLIYDAMRMRFRELTLRKDPDCPVCGTHPTVTALIDYDQFCGIAPAPAAPAPTSSATDITPLELKARMDAGTTPFILDVREPNEYQINRIPGSVLIPLGDLPEAGGRARPERRDRHPVQVGRPLGQGRGVPAPAGLRQREEPDRRHPGLGGPGGSEPAQVLGG